MAIADQADDLPFGTVQTSVTVMPPVVIDSRAAAGQPPGGAIQGRASIRQVRDLGVAVGDQRLYELELDVRPDGREPYSLTHRSMVPAASAGRLALGASLPVQVSAQVPGQIVIDWAAA